MNLETYYTKYYRPLSKYAKYLTRDVDEAADILQETFEKAIEYPYNPTKGKGVYGYLVLLLNSVYQNRREKLQSQYSQLGAEVDLDDLGMYASYNPWPGITRSIELRERLEKMPRVRRYIAWLFMQGYTINEIEERVPLSRSAVHRQMEKIKEELL